MLDHTFYLMYITHKPVDEMKVLYRQSPKTLYRLGNLILFIMLYLTFLIGPNNIDTNEFYILIFCVHRYRISLMIHYCYTFKDRRKCISQETYVQAYCFVLFISVSRHT